MMRIIALLCALGLFMPSIAYAQVADPDTLEIITVNAFDSVINDDDLLVVVRYFIDYDTLPIVTTRTTFMCRFLVDGSDENSSEILPFNNSGYGLGVCSFYWTATEKLASSIEFNNPNGETYLVTLQGKPSAFADPPSISSSNIQYADADNTRSELTDHIIATAFALEANVDWIASDFDLITFSTGQEVLTSTGESYFSQVIPNLSTMIPDLFSSSVIKPFVDERDFTFNERDRLETFWDGTGLTDSFEAGGDLFNVSAFYFKAIVGLAIIVAVAALGGKLAGSSEFGILTSALTIPLMGVIGFLSLTFIAIAAGIGAIALGFTLFLRRAG